MDITEEQSSGGSPLEGQSLWGGTASSIWGDIGRTYCNEVYKDNRATLASSGAEFGEGLWWLC